MRSRGAWTTSATASWTQRASSRRSRRRNVHCRGWARLSAVRSLLDGSPAEALVRFECERARAWFDRGLALVALLDGRSAACVLAMAGIYRRVLDRIEADPRAALASRTTLPAWEKAWVALSSLRAARPAARRPHPPREPAIGGSG